MSAAPAAPSSGAVAGGGGGGGGGDQDAALEIVVRVVSGRPNDEELAATQAVLAAVLAEQAARGAARTESPIDLWRSAARAPRASVHPGPGAWAASRGQRGC